MGFFSDKKLKREVIDAQIQKNKEGGMVFYNDPSDRKVFTKIQNRRCCGMRNFYMTLGLIAVLGFIAYYTISDKDPLIKGDGIKLQTKMSYNEGVDADVYYHLTFSTTKDQFQIPRGSQVDFVFQSDKYEIIRRSVTFDKELIITPKHNFTTFFIIPKTNFVASTKMQVLSTGINLNGTISLR